MQVHIFSLLSFWLAPGPAHSLCVGPVSTPGGMMARGFGLTLRLDIGQRTIRWCYTDVVKPYI